MATTSAQAGGAGAFAASNNAAFVTQHNTLLIGELRAGIQWNKCLNCGYIDRCFARFGFEYQYWGLVNGLTTSSTSFAGHVGDQMTITADQRNFNAINFVGLGVAAGCFW
jgi:hypothetical protein